MSVAGHVPLPSVCWSPMGSARTNSASSVSLMTQPLVLRCRLHPALLQLDVMARRDCVPATDGEAGPRSVDGGGGAGRCDDIRWRGTEACSSGTRSCGAG